MRADSVVIVDAPALEGSPDHPSKNLSEILPEISASEIFVVATQAEKIREILSTPSPKTVVPIGCFLTLEQARALDDAGAWFLADTQDDLSALLHEPRSPFSLSIVLIAFNEQDAIVRAIEDADRFGRVYATDHEIVVVEDGSRDATLDRVKALNHPKVRLVVHEKNQGMGGALRDGFLAATKELIAPLPADRQVRAHSLLPLLMTANEQTSAVSTYRGQPSGLKRAVLSVVFRTILRLFGGLEVNFAGSYMFHRRWLETVAPRTIGYQSYLLSFEVLKRLKKAGSLFSLVQVLPFPRETGASTEIRFSRILLVLREIFSVRLGRHG